MFPVQGASAVTPGCFLLSMAGEVLGQGTGWPGVGGVELRDWAAVPAAHMGVAQWQPSLFLGQAAVI